MYPNIYMQSTTKGIYTWANVVLPSLLPFFFFTKILSMTPDIQSFTKVFNKPIRKLYNCPSIASYISIMSIISGYPVGAKLTSEFFKNNIISSNQAHRIISFCSTSGPLFIIGSVGIGLFGNQTCGILIFISHIISSLLNGLIYRRYKLDNSNNQVPTYQLNNNILNDSMYNTINSVMMVGGFIAISFVVIDIVNNLHLLSPIQFVLDNIFQLSKHPNLSCAIINGTMEVTRGCVDLSSTVISPYLSSIIACGLISFGGLSVHLQSIVFLSECKIKYKYFLLTKITHSLLSIGVCALLGLFIL
jgi:sporulation integral membrane protein YlbJ